MSGNIELSKEAPLDARRKVNTFAELFLEATWKDSNNKVWLYDGMTVEVGDRLGELWQLKSKTSYSRQEDWVKISGGIEEAPKDGNPYMRKNGAWNAYTQIEEVYTFVADINGNKISQDAYNGLKAAVKAGKIIAIKLVDIDGRWIVSLSNLSEDTINLIVYAGDAFQTLAIKSDLTVVEVNKNFILRDNTIAYDVTGDYNPAHKKYVDTAVSGVNTAVNNVKNNVLLKNNTTSYTPTQDYHPSTKQYVDNSVKSVQDNVILKNNNTPYNPTNDYNPATKKYVDNIAYGKVIVVSDISKFLYNVELNGADAEQRTIDLFGNIDNFKNVVADILANHTRYYFHINNNPNNNCIELGCVNAWVANDSTSYELHFIITYFGNNPVEMFTNRISIVSNDDNRESKVIITSLVNSDNINTITNKTKSEYDGISTKQNKTAYLVTDD